MYRYNSQVKRKSGLIIRLKAIKSKKNIFYYLSFYLFYNFFQYLIIVTFTYCIIKFLI